MTGSNPILSLFPLRYFLNEVLELSCEPNKALASKCITGKNLTLENGVFEIELNNCLDNEILNDKLWTDHQVLA
ncbi:hypothetical protein SAMN05192553_101746 [Cyclobacterium xiamenense]|uniref:Uncharacterized protein n=1 Tax=Cyclobacterium xiamenense TaxID=1297121 RepID=A0A1H6UNQ9_9BACT|nr:hypothetical protein [Cyclobacterium xiamenense]SEI89665.1 hypothetical protein SAMN05192553_101746 [Cyclobacterium xiamenense]